MSDTTDRIGDRLDRPDQVDPQYRHLVADDAARVAKILEWPVSGRVLDVGCSDGAISRRIAKAWSVSVLGVDTSALRWPDIVRDYAERHDGPLVLDGSVVAFCDVRGNNYRVPGGDLGCMTRVAFGEMLVDAVYCTEVFEHLSLHEATLALRNICAVLKPGGDLIVTVPNRYAGQQYVNEQRDRWRWPDHWSVWTTESLADFLLPHFDTLDWKFLYPGDLAWVNREFRQTNASIWLMVRACGRR